MEREDGEEEAAQLWLPLVLRAGVEDGGCEWQGCSGSGDIFPFIIMNNNLNKCGFIRNQEPKQT